MSLLSHSLFAGLIGAALLSAGCDDSLKSVSLIEETRVLGARVEVEGDPTRSAPAPGERATLRWFVVAPDGEPNVADALTVCAVSPTNSGFPSCAGAPFASTLRAEPAVASPELSFQVPAGLDLALTPHAFASGLICADGAARVDGDRTPSCAGGTGTEVAFEFDLASATEANHSPTFASDALLLDGLLWPASDPAATCADGLPAVNAKTQHRLEVSLPAEAFEPLVQASAVDPARETLLVSQFSSAGTLSHAFTSLDANSPAESRQVSWDAPDAPTATEGSALLVRFYFVVRDTRGGEDFAARALCVVP